MFLQSLQCPIGMDKSKMRNFKLKEIKYYLMDKQLYWKDPVSLLLKCADKDE